MKCAPHIFQDPTIRRLDNIADRIAENGGRKSWQRDVDPEKRVGRVSKVYEIVENFSWEKLDADSPLTARPNPHNGTLEMQTACHRSVAIAILMRSDAIDWIYQPFNIVLDCKIEDLAIVKPPLSFSRSGSTLCVRTLEDIPGVEGKDKLIYPPRLKLEIGNVSSSTISDL